MGNVSDGSPSTEIAGTVLLLAASPAGRGRVIDAASVLPALAAVPPDALTGTRTATVVELADPVDQHTVLSRLRTAAAAPGPLVLVLAGQLHVDPKQHRLHLALGRTTPASMRYTALPWHWLVSELAARPPEMTTALIDAAADPDAWPVLRRQGLTLGPAVRVYGRVTPPAPRRRKPALPRQTESPATPEYLAECAALWRGGARPPFPELHEWVVRATGSEDALLLSVDTPAHPHPMPPAADTPFQPNGGQFTTSPLDPSLPPTTNGHTPYDPAHPPAPSDTYEPTDAPAPPAPHEPEPQASYEPEPPVSYEPEPPVPYAAQPSAPYQPEPPVPHEQAPAAPYAPEPPAPYAPQPPAPYEPEPAAAPEPEPTAQTPAPEPEPEPAPQPTPEPAAPAPAPAPAPEAQQPPQASPPVAAPRDAEPSGPSRATQEALAAVLAAAHAGRHAEAASLAAASEAETARTQGPGSLAALHWLEVRADLARLAEDPPTSCGLWLEAAAARLARGQAADDVEVEAAVDRAHHQWEHVADIGAALALATELERLRTRVPGRQPGAARLLRDRLDHLRTLAPSP